MTSKLTDRRAQQAQTTNPAIPTGYVTITQAHSLTGIPKRTLQGWAKDKRVDTRKAGRMWYVNLADVQHVAATIQPGTKAKHKATTWPTGGLAEWTKGDTAYISCVFSWRLPEAYQQAVWLRAMGYQVHAGGPAVILHPDYLADVATVNALDIPALHHHNPNATFTTRGCIRRCPWCASYRVEGDFRELPHWEPRPIVCDNNILAASQTHFNRVIDSLKPVPGVDFISGFDVRLLYPHHAQRIAELDIRMVRLAWDDVNLETQVHNAIMDIRQAGIGKKRIKVYVLVGFNDTPDDALYRLKTLKHEWGIDPYPSRYQPPDAMQRNTYVAPGWTERELRNITRYWSRTRYLGAIPYDEYKRPPARKPWLRRDPLPHTHP